MHHFGWHDCLICKNSEGNGSLIIEYGGKSYRCPAMIYHYINDHGYNPGEEVIEAILNGEYRKEE